MWMDLNWSYIKETKLQSKRGTGLESKRKKEKGEIKNKLENNNIWRNYINQQNLERSKTAEYE